MEYVWIIGALGWLLALAQFISSIRRTREQQENELLERTLNYFEKGPMGRSIGLSLVESIWLNHPKQLRIIIPVLIAQLLYLFFESEADGDGVEARNAIRILYLLNANIDLAFNPILESVEVSEALIRKASFPGGVPFNKTALRHWFARFNSNNTDHFDAETNDT